MSEISHTTRGGEFATSRRGGIDAYEAQFIHARSREGRTTRQIAKMIGRAVEDITPYMADCDAPPPPIQRPDPVRDVEYVEPERIPSPGDIVLSLWRGLLVVPPRHTTRLEIAKEVAQRYGITLEALRGPSRLKVFTVPRQEAMWRMVQARRWSTPQIGDFFGGKDHTTVLHACKRHEERMAAALQAEEAKAA